MATVTDFDRTVDSVRPPAASPLRSRIRGCLLGGAAGDALGYPVEFMSRAKIHAKYGENGITTPVLTDGKALISDDTQMTLFTAEGVFLYERSLAASSNAKCRNAMYQAYRDWLFTQDVAVGRASRHHPATELCSVQALHAERAPGFTCLRALRSAKCGRMDDPINNSKGNGCVMRVAPIALYYGRNKQPVEDTMRMAAESAAVTHGHPLGFITAAAATSVLSDIVYDRPAALQDAFRIAAERTEKMFAACEETAELLALMARAESLTRDSLPDAGAIAQLGRSGCAESAFAIAQYCACKHADSFADAIHAAVHFDGDSDTVAAITGNIMGAWLGLEAIPARFTEHLECRDVIERVAERIFAANA